MGWTALAADAPLDSARPPAQQPTAVPSSQASQAPAPPPGAAPAGFALLPPDAQMDGESAPSNAPSPQTAPDYTAVNEAMRQMYRAGKSPQEIADYGTHHGVTPNIEQINDARSKGFGDVNFAHPSQPVIESRPAETSAGQQFLDNTKNDVAGIAQGAAALPDMAATAAGKIMSVIPTAVGSGLDALGFHNAAGAAHEVAHDLANPVRIGDVVESVAPTPDTTSGHVNRFVGQMVGGAVGMPTSALENVAARIVGEVPKGFAVPPPQEAADAQGAAKAAQDLNIDLPAFTVKGTAAQAKAASLTRKGAFGAKGLGQSAQSAIDQAQGARDQIASDIAQPQPMDASLGSDIKDAAVDARSQDRARIGRMFDSGDQQMGDTPIALTQTRQALSNLVSQDGQTIVPNPVTPLINQIQQRIADLGGTMTAANLRRSTQNLKSLMRANSIDATTSDHIMSVIRDGMNGDMEAAAKQSGNENALQTYQDAREQWAASKAIDKTVLKPILGAAFQNTGDQVVNAIKAAVKNNGTRVAQLFSTLPPDTANTARASLIARMGIPANGASDQFSLPEFLKNYNQLEGSRNLIFPRETAQALDRLASVAQYGKTLQTVAQNGANAQSFGLKKLMTSGPAALGEAAFMWTHDVKDLAVGTAVSALSALGQWRAAKLLSSPEFAQRLANMPLNPKAAVAYWSRPSVKALAVKNPAIAAELQAFQYNVLNSNGVVSSAAASPQPQQQSQNQ